ncbi:MAG TPA: hypothetical protein VGG06_09805 [Thermoanaerobaculia bacterium]
MSTLSPRRAIVVFLWPLSDLLSGLDRCLGKPSSRRGGYRALALVGLGLAAGWWAYVPIHELLHAAGCLAAGGTVSRLEISPVYGGALLERLVPFVEAGGDYAGRLSGFDDGGSDAVYLATVFAPYLATLWPGVWALRRAGAAGRAFAFGFVVPVALAPFVALPGDAYEIGSIVVTRLPPWTAWAETLRGDDVVLLVSELWGREGAPWGGVAAGVGVGVLWAFATYAAGVGVASLLGRPSRVRS